MSEVLILSEAGFVETQVRNRRTLPKEAVRALLNEWMESSGQGDAVQGFDGITSDDIVATKPQP